MSTDSRYPSHIASNTAICWMLFGLRCCSWRPYSKRTALNEPLSRDGEALLVEGHERDHVPPGRTQHGLVAGTFHSTVAMSGGS
jgi:hypothetical protein